MTLSEETLALIAEANRRTDPLAVKSALQMIGRAGQPLAIIHIISHTLDSRGAVAGAAAGAVATLRRLVSARDLGIFERAFRHESAWTYSATPWQKMTATDLPRIAALPGGAAVLQLAMCHPSGYVREEAIRRSASCSDGTEIAFLLFRANDWVKPVRELAQAALRARLTIEHVADLVAALPILDAMHRWGRLHGTIVDEIERLLRDPRAVPGLMVASRSPDRYVRRSAFRRLFEQAQRTSFGNSEASEGGPYRQAAYNAQAKLDLFAAAMGDVDPTIHT